MLTSLPAEVTTAVTSEIPTTDVTEVTSQIPSTEVTTEQTTEIDFTTEFTTGKGICHNIYKLEDSGCWMTTI